MSREQFRLVNGFSNVFWGWGGEDDDMANRIKAHGLHISRYPANIARYKMLTHKKEKANPKRFVKIDVMIFISLVFYCPVRCSLRVSYTIKINPSSSK